MSGKKDQLIHGAHIKRNTEGTSNELSLSVLDAAKNALDGEEGTAKDKESPLGKIPFFSFRRHKKPRSTPAKEKGILLPSGEFISTEDDGGKRQSADPIPSMATHKPEQSNISGSGPIPGLGGLKIEGMAQGKSGSSGKDGSSKNRSPGLPLFGGSKKKSSKEKPTAPQDSSLEVKRRKSKRLRHRILVACLVVVVVGAVIALASTANTVIKTNNNIRDQILLDIDSIEKADEAVIELDSLVTKRASDLDDILDETAEVTATFQQTQDEWDRMAASIDEATSLLDQAEADLKALQPNIKDTRDQGAADQALKAIDARKNMISIGSDFLQTSFIVEQDIDMAFEAWQYVLSGDNKTREAAAKATDTTIDNAHASIDLNNQAISDFNEALSRFDDLLLDFPDIDFEAYQAYVSKKIEALTYAIASDQAYIDRNKEQAAQQNDAYNKADSEATELASKLKGDPAALIAENSAAKLRSDVSEYSAQRLLAGETDAFIRDYLGEGTK